MNGSVLWFLPFALQGLAMGVDEFGFHRQRTLPRWEWLGHALDTSVFLACLACPLLFAPVPRYLRLYGVLAELRAHFGERPLAILDVACGGGFLANPLASAGHQVTGIDLSRDSLDVAQRHDPTGSLTYLAMDARSLSFPDGHFDVVCMMDFLEHLPERDAVIGEASRVLRPGGWFFFHTFNRTPISRLIAIKGVEWFVKNTPKHMHVYELFLKPSKLQELCARHHLALEVVRGVRPRVFTLAFLKMLFTGSVSDQFRFVFTRSQRIGYCGRARKFA